MAHRLEINDLTVAYRRTPVLHHIDLTLRCGTCVGLLGPNGAGKTTFLKAIAGLVPKEGGKIILHGLDPRHSAREIAYLPQREAVDWDFPITVRGLAEMGRYPHVGPWRAFGEEDHRAVEEALRVMNLVPLADRQISALSGGQQQRAFLARSWAQQAHVYLLDEPFTGLDRNAQEDLRLALRRLTESHRLAIVSHHNLATVPDLFDEVVLLNGDLVAAGPVAEVFTPELIDKTFGTAIYTGPAKGPRAPLL